MPLIPVMGRSFLRVGRGGEAGGGPAGWGPGGSLGGLSLRGYKGGPGLKNGGKVRVLERFGREAMFWEGRGEGS